MSVAASQFSGPSYGCIIAWIWPISAPRSGIPGPIWPPGPKSAPKLPPMLAKNCSKGVPLNGLSSRLGNVVTRGVRHASTVRPWSRVETRGRAAPGRHPRHPARRGRGARGARRRLRPVGSPSSSVGSATTTAARASPVSSTPPTPAPSTSCATSARRSPRRTTSRRSPPCTAPARWPSATSRSSAPRRPATAGEAFDATRALIDTLKDEVPIWKHQTFADGTEEWVGSP